MVPSPMETNQTSTHTIKDRFNERRRLVDRSIN